MVNRTLKQVIMECDNLTSNEADELISEAKQDLMERLAEGEIPFDICADWFGLEPDYIMDLM